LIAVILASGILAFLTSVEDETIASDEKRVLSLIVGLLSIISVAVIQQLAKDGQGS